MITFKCKMCGGDLHPEESATTCECEYCGSVQTIPTADNEKKMNLFGRAQRLLRSCEFDKAAGIYESIVAEFPEEAEAYWGLVLCKYGIEYVDDPATGKKVPTCHRSSFDSVMEDGNFDQACENADVVARRVYRDEAKAIEELRKGIIEVSGREAPYDIFICYKETDEKGDRTLDSVLAQDIFDALIERGYRVFFSRITLEDKLGQEYEPFIFAALNSAKVMLAVGTDYEYYNAVWVKNEWSRFLKLIANGEKKTLIPCYKNLDAYDMPKEFARLQAQDLGKVGAMQDLMRGIEKILPKKTEAVKEEIGTRPETVQAAGPTVQSLLERGTLSLEDRKWDKAKQLFDDVLNIDPKCAEAYLGLVMAESQYEARHMVSADYVDGGIRNNRNLSRAKQFSKGELRQWFDNMDRAAEQSDQNKRARLEREKMQQEQEQLERIRQYDEKRKCIKTAKGMFINWDEHYFGLRSNGTVLMTGGSDEATQKIAHWRGVKKILAAGPYLFGLRWDGTVLSTDVDDITAYNTPSNLFGLQWDRTALSPVVDDISAYGANPIDVRAWTDIEDISADPYTYNTFIIGLKRDGTVIAAGNNEFGQCEVQEWHDIVAIAQDVYCSFGIKKDGSVVATGQNECGQEEIRTWKDIQAIYTCAERPIGLRRDGTLVTVDGGRDFGQQAMKEWNDIVDLCMDESGYVIGLRRDGTVVVSNPERRIPSRWQDIVTVASDVCRTYGVKQDGTVLSSESAYSEEQIISQWHNIIALFTNASIVGLTTDGRVMTVGIKLDRVQQELERWKLFDNIETLEQERQNTFVDIKQNVDNTSTELNERVLALREELCSLRGLFANRRRKEIEQEIRALESQMD